MNEPLGPAIVPENFRSTKHIAKRGVMWFAICMVSGAPSLVWGTGFEFNHIAMILGIVMFALGMTIISSTDYSTDLVANSLCAERSTSATEYDLA